jgi:hypothetical protein
MLIVVDLLENLHAPLDVVREEERQGVIGLVNKRGVGRQRQAVPFEKQRPKDVDGLLHLAQSHEADGAGVLHGRGIRSRLPQQFQGAARQESPR